MTDTTNLSGTLTRSSKQQDTNYPHYYNSFQNFCCGPKSNTSTSTSSKEFSPIPERFARQAIEILSVINKVLTERLSQLKQYTSVLPAEFFDPDPHNDCQRYLIDRAMHKMLTETQVINWVPSLKPLYPVRTSGNGNCLLHAVLIAMVGVHDFNLHLRDALIKFMNKHKARLKECWKIERIKTDALYGIQTEDSKLDSEWEELCDLVRYENAEDGQTASNLQFLEAVHIFSVSNMLGRPIIVLSEDVVRNKHGEAISYNDLFGIYLPTFMNSSECAHQPIVLAYDQSHFCPLQANSKDLGSKQDNYLPLYQSYRHIQSGELLPIRFLGNDTNGDRSKKLLSSYLSIKSHKMFRNSNHEATDIYTVELGKHPFSEKDNFFHLYYDYLLDFFNIQKKNVCNDVDQRSREQDYDFSNPPSTTMYQRSMINYDNSSPPPPYSSTVNRLNDTRSNVNYERRSSYDKAVANGIVHTSSNDGNHSKNSNLETSSFHRSNNQVTATQRLPTLNGHQYYNEKQTPSKSNWDTPIDDSLSSTKTNNSANSNTGTGDSRLKQVQQRNFVRIPVNHGRTDLSSTNLIDFDQSTDKLRTCNLCRRLFNDMSSTGLCPDCERKSTCSVLRIVPASRYSQPNYPQAYNNSDFISPLPTTYRRIDSSARIIQCPHCRFNNSVSNFYNQLIFYCKGCGRPVRF